MTKYVNPVLTPLKWNGAPRWRFGTSFPVERGPRNSPSHRDLELPTWDFTTRTKRKMLPTNNKCELATSISISDLFHIGRKCIDDQRTSEAHWSLAVTLEAIWGRLGDQISLHWKNGQQRIQPAGSRTKSLRPDNSR